MIFVALSSQCLIKLHVRHTDLCIGQGVIHVFFILIWFSKNVIVLEADSQSRREKLYKNFQMSLLF